MQVTINTENKEILQYLELLKKEIMELLIAFLKSIFITIPIMIIWVAIKIKWKEWKKNK